MKPSSISIGTTELVIAMMLSGTIGYFVISSEQSLWNVVFFRCLIGAITLGGYAYFTGMIKREFFERRVLSAIIIGGVALVANWILLFASFHYIPFSIATVAYHMQPLFLVLAGAFLTKDKLSGNLIFWLSVAFIGLFLMVELDMSEIRSLFHLSQADGEKAEATAFIGLLLALGAAILYTLTTLMTKKSVRFHHSLSP